MLRVEAKHAFSREISGILDYRGGSAIVNETVRHSRCSLRGILADTLHCVIKSLIIFVLTILLVGGAFLSRPTEPDFEKYLQANKSKDNSNWLDRLFSRGQKNYTFKDRYLWVTIEQDGKTTFVGAFSTFWSVGGSGPSAGK